MLSSMLALALALALATACSAAPLPQHHDDVGSGSVKQPLLPASPAATVFALLEAEGSCNTFAPPPNYTCPCKKDGCHLSKTYELLSFVGQDDPGKVWCGTNFLGGSNENVAGGACRSQGKYTFFAPTNVAWAKLPKATMDHLIKNQQQLAEVLAYHVLAATVDWDQAQDKQVFTMGNSQPTILRTMVDPEDPEASCGGGEGKPALFGGGESCVTIDGPGTSATNGVMFRVDEVLLPPWLPQPGALSGIDPACCDEGYPGWCYDKKRCDALPKETNELWFRAVVNTTYWRCYENCTTYLHCGQVNAASAVPASLFNHPDKLKDYIAVTLKLWGKGVGNNLLEQGKCEDAGYPNKIYEDPNSGEDPNASRDISWAAGFPGLNSVCENDGICGCHIGQCPNLAPDGNCTAGYGPTRRGGVPVAWADGHILGGGAGPGKCPNKEICGVCGTLANRGREVKFFCPAEAGICGKPRSENTTAPTAHAVE